MQNINRFLTRCQIDYAVGPCCVPYANLFYPRTHSFHRLPVLRFETPLHEVQIEAGIAPRLTGEGFQIIVAVPTNCSGLRVTSTLITIQVLVYSYKYLYKRRSDFELAMKRFKSIAW
jgi:hypothetical protein